MCFLDLLWVVPTSTFPHWMPPPRPLGLPAVSSPNLPPPRHMDPFPRVSPWSKKSKTTSHSTKMITSPPLAASPPAPLTKVRQNVLSLAYEDGCLSVFKVWDVGIPFYRYRYNGTIGVFQITKKWAVLRWNLQLSTHCCSLWWQEVIELMFKLQWSLQSIQSFVCDVGSLYKSYTDKLCLYTPAGWTPIPNVDS